MKKIIISMCVIIITAFTLQAANKAVFAVISDVHTDLNATANDNLEKIYNQIAAADMPFIINCGDNWGAI